jgi:CBS-domain-containing membrane protein
VPEYHAATPLLVFGKFFAKMVQLPILMIIGSFGASAVLIYGAIRNPLVQPRNLIGGQLISAVIQIGILLT